MQFAPFLSSCLILVNWLKFLEIVYGQLPFQGLVMGFFQSFLSISSRSNSGNTIVTCLYRMARIAFLHYRVPDFDRSKSNIAFLARLFSYSLLYLKGNLWKTGKGVSLNEE